VWMFGLEIRTKVLRLWSTETTGFPFERKHWCRCQTRRGERRDPTAPSGQAHEGWRLIRHH
jgi:hypothetical protein